MLFLCAKKQVEPKSGGFSTWFIFAKFCSFKIKLLSENLMTHF